MQQVNLKDVEKFLTSYSAMGFTLEPGINEPGVNRNTVVRIETSQLIKRLRKELSEGDGS